MKWMKPYEYQFIRITKLILPLLQFDASAADNLWKHWDKKEKLLMSNVFFCHNVFNSIQLTIVALRKPNCLVIFDNCISIDPTEHLKSLISLNSLWQLIIERRRNCSLKSMFMVRKIFTPISKSKLYHLVWKGT